MPFVINIPEILKSYLFQNAAKDIENKRYRKKIKIKDIENILNF